MDDFLAVSNKPFHGTHVGWSRTPGYAVAVCIQIHLLASSIKRWLQSTGGSLVKNTVRAQCSLLPPQQTLKWHRAFSMGLQKEGWGNSLLRLVRVGVISPSPADIKEAVGFPSRRQGRRGASFSAFVRRLLLVRVRVSCFRYIVVSAFVSTAT